jgi:FMS-like tyrosine kinase 1
MNTKSKPKLAMKFSNIIPSALELAFIFAILNNAFAADSRVVVKSEDESIRLVCLATVPQELDRAEWIKDGKAVGHGIVRKDEYELTSTLELSNLRSEDVGLYQCQLPVTEGLQVYLYVRNTRDLIVPLSEAEKVVNVYPRKQSIIPCRPTEPNVQMLLINQITQSPIDLASASIYYDPQTGFVITEGKLTQHNGFMKCYASRGPRSDQEFIHVVFNLNGNNELLPTPNIQDDQDTDWIVGQERSLTCSVTLSSTYLGLVSLSWRNPALMNSQHLEQEYSLEGGRVSVIKRVEESPDRLGYYVVTSEIKINPVSFGDQGDYSCELAKFGDENSKKSSVQVVRVYDNSSSIQLDLSAFNPNVTVIPGKSVKWVVGIYSTFRPSINWIGPDLDEIEMDEKYMLMFDDENINLFVYIYDIQASDMGKYVLQIFDPEDPEVFQELSMHLYVKAAPAVDFESDIPLLMPIGEKHTILCHARGFPAIQSVEIEVEKCDENFECDEADDPYDYKHSVDVFNTGHVTRIAQVTLETFEIKAGRLVCTACNRIGCTTEKTNFIVSDIAEAMKVTKFIEAEDVIKSVTLTCQASKYLFDSLTWEKKDPQQPDTFKQLTWEDAHISVTEPATGYSIFSNITFENFTSSDNGNYRCQGFHFPPIPTPEDFPTEFERSAEFFVDEDEPSKPFIQGYNFQNASVLNTLNEDGKLTLICRVTGNPEPTVSWYKNDRAVSASSKKYSMSQDRKSLTVNDFKPRKDNGKYSCHAKNKLGTDFAYSEVHIKEKSNLTVAISVPLVAVIVIGLVMGVGYYKRKASRAKSRLPSKDVEKLKNGDPDLLNELEEALLGEGEKALMLPYDSKKLEFPYEKIDLGSQIGAGAFGRVLKVCIYDSIFSWETKNLICMFVHRHKLMESFPVRG